MLFEQKLLEQMLSEQMFLEQKISKNRQFFSLQTNYFPYNQIFISTNERFRKDKLLFDLKQKTKTNVVITNKCCYNKQMLL